MTSSSLRIIWIRGFLILTIITMIIVVMLSCEKNTQKKEEIGTDRLLGRWLRPDGGYVLEINSAKENGSLEAAYFNPKPINVSEAKWSRKNNRLRIYVEFSDVNYPGSYYKLDYYAHNDRLIGTYFQAVIQQNFSVEFVRKRE